MPRIVRTNLAERDLAEIFDYIASDNQNAAVTMLRRIEKSCQIHADYPGSGRLRDELFPEMRSAPVGKYIIFYRPIEDGIEVMRVLHGARDIEAQFN